MDMVAIDRFIARLARALSGPRRAKADMLVEVRDGLLDAAEAYRLSGLDAISAQQRAIAEFGTVEQLAAELRNELAVAQARRTALLICGVLATQPLIWDALGVLTGAAVRVPGHNGTAYAVVNGLVRCAGAGGIAIGLLAALAAGIGTRYLGCRPGLARGIGRMAYVVCGVFAGLGLALTLLSPATSPWGMTGLPATVVLLGAPLSGTAVAGRRCLRATHPVA